MLITFSGLDGAGKSTLVRALRRTLERERRPVVVYHMNDDIGVYAWLRRLRDRIRGVPHRGERVPAEAGMLRRLRTAVLWGKTLRRVIYPFDLVCFLVYRLYHERLRGRVLIMDRYFYDTLVDVADGRHWGLLRLYERLTPTPDLAVLLDVGPEESYARKADYPLDYLRERWVAYRTVFPWVRTAVFLRNDDLQAAEQAVTRQVERLAA